MHVLAIRKNNLDSVIWNIFPFHGQMNNLLRRFFFSLCLFYRIGHTWLKTTLLSYTDNIKLSTWLYDLKVCRYNIQKFQFIDLSKIYHTFSRISYIPLMQKFYLLKIRIQTAFFKYLHLLCTCIVKRLDVWHSQDRLNKNPIILNTHPT